MEWKAAPLLSDARCLHASQLAALLLLSQRTARSGTRLHLITSADNIVLNGEKGVGSLGRGGGDEASSAKQSKAMKLLPKEIWLL